MAATIFQNTIDPAGHGINEKMSVAERCEALTTALDVRSEISKVAKEEELRYKKLTEGDDLEDHLKTLNQLRKEANDAGCEITEQAMISIILMSLPMMNCWGPATMMYQNTTSAAELGQ
jgi:uncharacterized membrane protein (DUF106 family)